MRPALGEARALKASAWLRPLQARDPGTDSALLYAEGLYVAGGDSSAAEGGHLLFFDNYPWPAEELVAAADNPQPSAARCSDSCFAEEGCNAWAFCSIPASASAAAGSRSLLAEGAHKRRGAPGLPDPQAPERAVQACSPTRTPTNTPHGLPLPAPGRVRGPKLYRPLWRLPAALPGGVEPSPGQAVHGSAGACWDQRRQGWVGGAAMHQT